MALCLQACLKLLLTWLVEKEQHRCTGEACHHSPCVLAVPQPEIRPPAQSQAAGEDARAAAPDGAAARGQVGQEAQLSAPGAAGAPQGAATGEGGGVEAGKVDKKRGREREGEREGGRETGAEDGEGFWGDGECWQAWRTASVERLQSLVALLGGTCCHLLAHVRPGPSVPRCTPCLPFLLHSLSASPGLALTSSCAVGGY